MASGVDRTEPGRAEPADLGSAVQTPLERCFSVGSRAYPELEFLWPDFERTALEFLEDEQPAPEADEYARLAVLADVPGASEFFAREFLAPLRKTIHRICRDHETTDITLQEIREKLLLPPRVRLVNYRAAGKFRAWLRVVATRTTLDVMRRQGARAKNEVTLETHLEALALDPEERFLREELVTQIRMALRAAIKRLPDRERHALRMHLVLGWNVTEIGQALSAHRATAARWIAAAKSHLNQLLREEISRVALDGSSEAASLLIEIPSRLDLSLTLLFRTTTLLTEQPETIT